jgi:hypothetical protein
MTLAGAVLLTGCGESSDEGSSDAVVLPEFDKSLIEDKIIQTNFAYDGSTIETSNYAFNKDGSAHATLLVNGFVTCDLTGQWSTSNTKAELRVNGLVNNCTPLGADVEFTVAYLLIDKIENGLKLQQRDGDGLKSDLVVTYIETEVVVTPDVKLIPFTAENFVARPFVVDEPLITDAGNYIAKSNNILFNEDNTITGVFEVFNEDGSDFDNCDLTGSWEIAESETGDKVTTVTEIDCSFFTNQFLEPQYNIEYQLIKELGNGIEVYVTDTDLNTAIAYTVYENNSSK